MRLPLTALIPLMLMSCTTSELNQLFPLMIRAARLLLLERSQSPP